MIRRSVAVCRLHYRHGVTREHALRAGLSRTPLARRSRATKVAFSTQHLDGVDMSTTPEKPGAQDDDQRKALEESEKKATEDEPENFKDKATDEKVVEVGPDMTKDPIKGIDAPERPASGR